MSPQSHAVDVVPHLFGGRLPEGLAHVGVDRLDAGVGVVDDHVEFAVLLLVDAVE